MSKEVVWESVHIYIMGEKILSQSTVSPPRVVRFEC